MKNQKIFQSIALVLLLAVMASCARNPVTNKRQFLVMSEAREIELGRSYDPQIVAGFGLYQNQTIQDYINAKGQEMVAISHRSHLGFEFKILDSPVVNAFAVPGGYVYFTRGIMAHFNNEAEFAGVLGHEIGHVSARHTVISQRNQVIGQLGLIAGIIAVPELAEMAQPLSNGMQLMFLKFGRDAESQSDELGVEYSCKIGYDAREMADFFNTLARIQEEAGVSIPTFLSTHPNPLNRKETVGELAVEWEDKLQMNDPKVGRNSYLQMVDGLVYGEDPRQGFVENSKFYHPELKFEFPVPAGWKYQNSPEQFQMAPENGKALMFMNLAQGSSLEESAAKVIQDYGLEVFNQDNATVGGLPAYVIFGQQKGQDGQAVADSAAVKAKVTLIQYNGLIYNITGVSLGSDFESYLSNFNQSMQGFKILTDSDKLNRQPDRLSVETVSQSGTLKSFLQLKGIPSSRYEEFAILNGMELTDQVPSGTMIKVLK